MKTDHKSVRLGSGTGQRWAIAAGFLAIASLVLLAAPVKLAIRAPNLHAALEVVLPASAMVAAWTLAPQFRRSRRLSDLLLPAGLVVLGAADLAFYTGPALGGSARVPFDSSSAVIARLLVGVIVAAAALVPRARLVHAWREVASPPSFLACVAIVGVLIALALSGPAAGSIPLTTGAGCLMVIAAAAFARTAARERQPVSWMLAYASGMFAVAWGYALRVPDGLAGSVSMRDLLRLVSYGFLVAAGMRYRSQLHRATAEEAAARERRRLANDLHDGLAQDLAFITGHGNRLAPDLGDEHPIVVAARRALEVSRGAIVDLATTDAPTPGAALEAVADDVSRRCGVDVQVATDAAELTMRQREDLVRIAREAIVNAVRHGGATRVSVSLRRSSTGLVLSIADDGCGVDRAILLTGRAGFGIGAMRQRAAALGGRLSVRAREQGGTEVEVVVP
jgi:signal transduction histidine kinase